MKLMFVPAVTRIQDFMYPFLKEVEVQQAVVLSAIQKLKSIDLCSTVQTGEILLLYSQKLYRHS